MVCSRLPPTRGRGRRRARARPVGPRRHRVAGTRTSRRPARARRARGQERLRGRARPCRFILVAPRGVVGARSGRSGRARSRRSSVRVGRPTRWSGSATYGNAFWNATSFASTPSPRVSAPRRVARQEHALRHPQRASMMSSDSRRPFGKPATSPPITPSVEQALEHGGDVDVQPQHLAGRDVRRAGSARDARQEDLDQVSSLDPRRVAGRSPGTPCRRPR